MNATRSIHGRRLAPTLAVIGLATTLLALPCLAADTGGTPGGYLRYGASARSLALGNAVGGLADDAATSYWNPAGLAWLRTMELSAMGATLISDTKYGFVTLGLPTEHWGTFALSGTYTRSADFERTTLFEDLDETFSEGEGIFSLAYARGGRRWSFGAAVKTVSQSIAGSQANGTGLDLGVSLRPHRSLSLGMSVQNAIAPKITLVEDEEELPWSVRGGFALHFFRNKLQVSADGVKTRWMDTSYRAGLEVWPTRPVAMRAGYDGEKDQWSVGAGMRWENLQFDYAYVNTDLGGQNVVSATLRFGVPYGVKVDRNKALFSPSGADREVTFGIRTAVRGVVESWRVEIRDDHGKSVKVLQGAGDPPSEVAWNGEDGDGRLVGDGVYTAHVTIIDDLGQDWDYESDVEVLGFQERTRAPIRVEIGSGAAGAAAGSDQR